MNESCNACREEIVLENLENFHLETQTCLPHLERACPTLSQFSQVCTKLTVSHNDDYAKMLI
jgi:hypothetical protein